MAAPTITPSEFSPRTQVLSPVTPANDFSLYPAQVANFGFGGLHSVETVADMRLIPRPRRQLGMIVHVLNDTTVTPTIVNTYYYLKNNADPVENGDWSRLFTAGAAGGLNTVEINSDSANAISTASTINIIAGAGLTAGISGTNTANVLLSSNLTTDVTTDVLHTFTAGFPILTSPTTPVDSTIFSIKSMDYKRETTGIDTGSPSSSMDIEIVNGEIRLSSGIENPHLVTGITQNDVLILSYAGSNNRELNLISPYLHHLEDVNVPDPAFTPIPNNSIIKFDSTTQKWINALSFLTVRGTTNFSGNFTVPADRTDATDLEQLDFRVFNSRPISADDDGIELSFNGANGQYSFGVRTILPPTTILARPAASAGTVPYIYVRGQSGTTALNTRDDEDNWVLANLSTLNDVSGTDSPTSGTVLTYTTGTGWTPLAAGIGTIDQIAINTATAIIAARTLRFTSGSPGLDITLTQPTGEVVVDLDLDLTIKSGSIGSISEAGTSLEIDIGLPTVPNGAGDYVVNRVSAGGALTWKPDEGTGSIETVSASGTSGSGSQTADTTLNFISNTANGVQVEVTGATALTADVTITNLRNIRSSVRTGTSHPIIVQDGTDTNKWVAAELETIATDSATVSTVGTLNDYGIQIRSGIPVADQVSTHHIIKEDGAGNWAICNILNGTNPHTRNSAGNVSVDYSADTLTLISHLPIRPSRANVPNDSKFILSIGAPNVVATDGTATWTVPELDDLSNVDISSNLLNNGDILVYQDGLTPPRFINRSPNAAGFGGSFDLIALNGTNISNTQGDTILNFVEGAGIGITVDGLSVSNTATINITNNRTFTNVGAGIPIFSPTAANIGLDTTFHSIIAASGTSTSVSLASNAITISSGIPAVAAGEGNANITLLRSSGTAYEKQLLFAGNNLFLPVSSSSITIQDRFASTTTLAQNNYFLSSTGGNSILGWQAANLTNLDGVTVGATATNNILAVNASGEWVNTTAAAIGIGGSFDRIALDGSVNTGSTGDTILDFVAGEGISLGLNVGTAGTTSLTINNSRTFTSGGGGIPLFSPDTANNGLATTFRSFVLSASTLTLEAIGDSIHIGSGIPRAEAGNENFITLLRASSTAWDKVRLLTSNNLSTVLDPFDFIITDRFADTKSLAIGPYFLQSDGSSPSALSWKSPVLNDMTNVATSGVNEGQVLTFNGSNWVPSTPSGGAHSLSLRFSSGDYPAAGVDIYTRSPTTWAINSTVESDNTGFDLKLNGTVNNPDAETFMLVDGSLTLGRFGELTLSNIIIPDITYTISSGSGVTSWSFAVRYKLIGIRGSSVRDITEYPSAPQATAAGITANSTTISSVLISLLDDSQVPAGPINVESGEKLAVSVQVTLTALSGASSLSLSDMQVGTSAITTTAGIITFFATSALRLEDLTDVVIINTPLRQGAVPAYDTTAENFPIRPLNFSELDYVDDLVDITQDANTLTFDAAGIHEQQSIFGLWTASAPSLGADKARLRYNVSSVDSVSLSNIPLVEGFYYSPRVNIAANVASSSGVLTNDSVYSTLTTQTEGIRVVQEGNYIFDRLNPITNTVTFTRNSGNTDPLVVSNVSLSITAFYENGVFEDILYIPLADINVAGSSSIFSITPTAAEVLGPFTVSLPANTRLRQRFRYSISPGNAFTAVSNTVTVATDLNNFKQITFNRAATSVRSLSDVMFTRQPADGDVIRYSTALPQFPVFDLHTISDANELLEDQESGFFLEDEDGNVILVDSDITNKPIDRLHRTEVSSTAVLNARNLLTDNATRKGLFADRLGSDLQFKSIKAGTGISLSSDDNEVTVSSNVTSGISISDGTNTLNNITSLLVSNAKVTGSSPAAVLEVLDSITNAGTSIDGIGLVNPKIGITTPIRRLKQGANIVLTEDVANNYIEISNLTGAESYASVYWQEFPDPIPGGTYANTTVPAGVNTRLGEWIMDVPINRPGQFSIRRIGTIGTESSAGVLALTQPGIYKFKLPSFKFTMTAQAAITDATVTFFLYLYRIDGLGNATQDGNELNSSQVITNAGGTTSFNITVSDLVIPYELTNNNSRFQVRLHVESTKAFTTNGPTDPTDPDPNNQITSIGTTLIERLHNT